jgi:hypothetical protein
MSPANILQIKMEIIKLDKINNSLFCFFLYKYLTTILRLLILIKIYSPIKPTEVINTNKPDVAAEVPILVPNSGDCKSKPNECSIDHNLE